MPLKNLIRGTLVISAVAFAPSTSAKKQHYADPTTECVLNTNLGSQECMRRYYRTSSIPVAVQSNEKLREAIKTYNVCLYDHRDDWQQYCAKPQGTDEQFTQIQKENYQRALEASLSGPNGEYNRQLMQARDQYHSDVEAIDRDARLRRNGVLP